MRSTATGFVDSWIPISLNMSAGAAPFARPHDCSYVRTWPVYLPQSDPSLSCVELCRCDMLCPPVQ